MKKLILIINLSIFALLSIYSSGQSETNSKPIVSVSIVPEATFVEKIAQDKVDIVTIIPKGSSPENYEPTPQQRVQFEKSDIYFSIGVPSEEFSILPMVGKNTTVISLADEVAKTYPAIYIGNVRDPHIWLSPKRVILMLDIISDELSKIDPNNATFYKTNAENYKGEINTAINNINSNLETVDNKNFLVYHPSFNYFAQDFNLTMYSIEEEGKEITPKTLIDVINKAKELNIKNIYYQAEIAAEQSIAFSKELGGKAILLDPLSPNYVDNLQIMANTLKENL